jgi:pSer/pThr/pTyr-binding forkhead associated (FHA) protein
MGLISFTTLAGALAGLLAWLLCEPFTPAGFFSDDWGKWQVWFSIALGSFIASSLGAVLGYAQGSRRHLLVGGATGFLIGAVGGSGGLTMGGALSQMFFGNALGDAQFGPTDIPARMMAFIPFGAFIGLVMGVPTRSWRQAMIGLLGGAVGGAIGGASFDMVSIATGTMTSALKGQAGQPVTETGMMGRAVTSAVIGASIGLVTSILQRATRTAWLRLVLGRNEGKEWVVDAPQTFIGRSEAAHVPLFGDNSIAPMHACIARQGGQYILMDGGSPAGTYLNNMPVKQAPLFHGAVIRIGTYNLEFLMRTGSAPQYGPEALRGAQPVQNQGRVPVQPAGIQTMAAAGGYGATAAIPTGAGFAATALVAMTGPISGQRFAVHGALEIGREAAGIALPFDGSASRRHAVVSPAANGLQLTDMGSTNGTFVNEQRVQNASLKAGDIVRIGVTSFRVE